MFLKMVQHIPNCNAFPDELEPQNEEENEKYQRLRVISLTNCAWSEVLQGHYVEAINVCNIALTLDPMNFKAFLRRAQAHKASIVPCSHLWILDSDSIAHVTGTEHVQSCSNRHDSST
jgi:hypothetical protein